MKLIAIDLDGTLLSTKHQISEENKAAIKKVQDANHIVAISTGRAFHDTLAILKEAELDCPIITGNGSISYHQTKMIRSLMIPAEGLQELVTILDDHQLYYEIYGSEGLYFLANGQEILTKEMNQGSDLSREFCQYIMERQYKQQGWNYLEAKSSEYLSTLAVYKIYCYSFNPEKLAGGQEILAKREDFSVIVSEKNSFEIVNKQSNKGAALVHLAKHLKIPQAQTVAIGDNYNDLSMFQVAGISVSMGNATQEIKNQSTYTSKSNDEHGVAHALKTYVLS